MLTDEEIQQIIKAAVTAKIPEWKREYMRRIADNLQVHTKGTLFSKVDTLFPNEHPDSKAHCVNTYEPITKGSIWKGINNIIRIFSNSSFKVSASDETLEFANAAQFDGSNLFNWLLENWITQGIGTDPNSLMAVYPPAYIEDQENINYADAVRFIKSQYLLKKEDDICIFISEEESQKEYAVSDSAITRTVFYDETISSLNSKAIVQKTYNQRIDTKVVKHVYHVFTKEYFLRFKDDGAQNYEWEVFPFDTPFNFVPVFEVGGIELFDDIFESFVQPFIPFGNLALLQHRNHRAVDLMFSYPRMSEIQTPCDNPSCHEGQVNVIGSEITETCKRCNGAGWITAQSPYKTYQKKIEPALTDPETMKLMLATNPVEFMTPDVGILDYSKDSWRGYLQMAEEAIFIQQTEQTGNVKSAEAKELDREMMYSFLQNIAKVFYDRMRVTVQCFENYMNASPVDCSVELPLSFAILTESEAFDALNSILNSSSPVFVKAQQVDNFIHKFVSKSSPIIKALQILKQVDPLLYYSTSDVQTFKSNNIITTDSWTAHVYAYPVLMKLYETDKSLFEKNDAAIINVLTGEIDKLKPAATESSLKNNLIAAA